MYKKIVVALDESKEAARALESAIELAGHLNAELTIVSVCEPLPSYTAFIDAEIPGAKQKCWMNATRSIAICSGRLLRRGLRLG